MAKRIESQLIAELLKNSKKSDRELAKIIGVSQPTITRTRTRLEKEGIIKEYTIIPNFSKIGLSIMAVTFFKMRREPTNEETENLKTYAEEYLKKEIFPLLIADYGIGMGAQRIVISYHKDYDSFLDWLRTVKQSPQGQLGEIETFLISLSSKDSFMPLTHKLLARYIEKKGTDYSSS
jgi:DNA-binding Lrp family transcriptional regulator